MISKSMRRTLFAVAVLATLLVAVDANAACCGGGATTAFYGGGYSAHYPSTYSSYYAGSYPSTYQTYSSGGWYPGYYWDRVRARLWGQPSTYVAAYPTTYTAAYAPSYSASYYPSASYAASYAAPSGCSTCSAGYAPSSSCSTCTAGYAPSCSTCTQQVTLRPVCGCPTACGTCETCTSGSASGVTQTSYQQSTGCATCNANAARETIIVREHPQHQQQQQRIPDEASQQTFSTGSNDGAPGLGPNENPATQREEQKPVTNGTDDTSTQPEPGSETEGYDPYDTNKEESSTYLQPPQLFDPKDRTAQKRHIAPVTTALYQKQATYRSVSARPITAEQAKQDAIGWESASE